MKTKNFEPNDGDMKAYLYLWDQSDAMKYDWADTKIVGTTSIMSTKGVICEVKIMVGDPLKWPIILMGSDKMIYSSFYDYVVPFYGCLFT